MVKIECFEKTGLSIFIIEKSWFFDWIAQQSVALDINDEDGTVMGGKNEVEEKS